MLQDTSAETGSAYDEIGEFFDAFNDDIRTAVGLLVELDNQLLLSIAQSFAYDLNRYQEFHEIDLPDRARRAAYLAKWLMRFRPVKLASDYESLGEYERKHALLLNELFCLYVASGVLAVDIEASLSDRIVNILLYSFRYRSSSEDTFILFFALLRGI